MAKTACPKCKSKEIYGTCNVPITVPIIAGHPKFSAAEIQRPIRNIDSYDLDKVVCTTCNWSYKGHDVLDQLLDLLEQSIGPVVYKPDNILAYNLVENENRTFEHNHSIEELSIKHVHKDSDQPHSHKLTDLFQPYHNQSN